jgi:hypothetical protein
MTTAVLDQPTTASEPSETTAPESMPGAEALADSAPVAEPTEAEARIADEPDAIPAPAPAPGPDAPMHEATTTGSELSDADAEYHQAVRLLVRECKTNPSVLTTGMSISRGEAKRHMKRMESDGIIERHDLALTVVPAKAAHILDAAARNALPADTAIDEPAPAVHPEFPDLPQFQKAIDLIRAENNADSSVLVNGLGINHREAKKYHQRLLDLGVIRRDGLNFIVVQVQIAAAAGADVDAEGDDMFDPAKVVEAADQQTPGPTDMIIAPEPETLSSSSIAADTTSTQDAGVKSGERGAPDDRQASPVSAPDTMATSQLPKMLELALDQIVVDPAIQPRESLAPDVVNDYQAEYQRGENMPPLVVYLIDGVHYLVAGFHRHEAARRAGRASLLCEIHSGSRDDAELAAIESNRSNAHRMSRADNNRAIVKMLKHPAWGQWVDAEIARRIGVDPKTVAARRHELNYGKSIEDNRRYMKGGKERMMSTENIGRKKKSKAKSPGPSEPGAQPKEDPAEEPAAPIDLQPLHDQLASLQTAMDKAALTAASATDKAALTSFAQQCRDYIDQFLVRLTGNTVAI